MKNIVLFDMDGTLTPARQSMERPVTDKLIQLQRAGFEIGIVTGSDLEYVKEQCQDLFGQITLDVESIHFDIESIQFDIESISRPNAPRFNNF